MPTVTDFQAAGSTPESAAADKLEIAFRPSGAGTPVFVGVPLLSEVKITPAGNIATADVYVDAGSPDQAWQFATKTGASWTMNFTTLGTEENATVSELISTSLKIGSAANILIKVTRASGAVWSGEVALSEPDPMSGARALASTAFKGTGVGRLDYTAPA